MEHPILLMVAPFSAVGDSEPGSVSAQTEPSSTRVVPQTDPLRTQDRAAGDCRSTPPLAPLEDGFPFGKRRGCTPLPCEFRGGGAVGLIFLVPHRSYRELGADPERTEEDSELDVVQLLGALRVAGSVATPTRSADRESNTMWAPATQRPNL